MSKYQFSVEDYITSVENNNIQEIELNAYAIKAHVHFVLKELLLDYVNSSFSKHSFNKILQEVYGTNLHVIKQELKIIAYLINNLDYLNNIDDKSRAVALIKIYYYLILTDFDRIDFVELNTNKGRSVISNYLLEEINEYFDQIINYLDIYSKSDKVNIRDVKNEE